jgi:hypothetical protein
MAMSHSPDLPGIPASRGLLDISIDLEIRYTSPGPFIQQKYLTKSMFYLVQYWPGSRPGRPILSSAPHEVFLQPLM